MSGITLYRSFWSIIEQWTCQRTTCQLLAEAHVGHNWIVNSKILRTVFLSGKKLYVPRTMSKDKRIILHIYVPCAAKGTNIQNCWPRSKIQNQNSKLKFKTKICCLSSILHFHDCILEIGILETQSSVKFHLTRNLDFGKWKSILKK